MRQVEARSAVPDILTPAEWAILMQHLQDSSREADVLREFFYDDRTAAIAAALGVSPHTVQTYRDRQFRRLQVGTS